MPHPDRNVGELDNFVWSPVGPAGGTGETAPRIHVVRSLSWPSLRNCIMNAKNWCSGDLVVVAVGVEQLLELTFVAGLDFQHPAVTVGVLVDQFGLVVEVVVDGDHFA